MRPHTRAEAERVCDLVGGWQTTFLTVLGRRLVFAADEYYLLAARPFPAAESYEGFPMHEDGIGMARTFELELHGQAEEVTGVRPGFFAWADSSTQEGASDEELYEPYRGVRTAPGQVVLRPRRGAPVGVLTGTYGAAVLEPLLAGLGRDDVRVVPVANEYFGGNVGVAGLLVGEDLARVLSGEPTGHRYLLPDVCLSQGRFLDGTTPEDLPRPVEVVPTDGMALRRALSVP
jgi:NifB/MoaA-like Fe-S oxidoreductase